RLTGPLAAIAPDIGTLIEHCRSHASPVYLGNHTALCRSLGLFKLFVDTRDRGFAANLLLDGGWELWATIFIAGRVRPGMVAIDIGANYGYYTLLLGWLVGERGRVVAIEPNPAAVDNLRRSVKLNGMSPRIAVVAAAAGAIHG